MLRAIRSITLGLGLLAIASVLMWHAAGVVAVRMNTVPPSPVSFADTGTVARELAAANHSPVSGAGSFLPGASIGEPDVRGVPLDAGVSNDRSRGGLLAWCTRALGPRL